jgi:MoxR-like ATPase
LLCLNTIENGYISFPDALVNCHPNFRLIATANPQDKHNFYTGRSKLDAATLDRFDIISINRDDLLEMSLIDTETHQRMQILRKILGEHNVAKMVSMRDAIRYQQRKDLNVLTEDFVGRLTDDNKLVLEKYEQAILSIPKHTNQSECKTIDDLIDVAKRQAGIPNKTGEQNEPPNTAV